MTWLQRAAHVRDGASRLETALLYAEATASPQPLRLRVAQLPRRAGDRWVGAARDRAAADRERAAVARRAVGGGAAPRARQLAGLVVDEWTEVIPDRTQLTGVELPRRRSPPPARRRRSCSPSPRTRRTSGASRRLEATVLETLDLARLRLVDAEALAAPRRRRARRAAARALPAGDLPRGRSGRGHRDHRPRAVVTAS